MPSPSPRAAAGGPGQRAGNPRSERLFGRLDTNSDGRLALEEMQPKAERRFLRLDTDGDGKVATAELDAWLTKIQERRRQRILDHMDLDKDGAVTKTEFDAYLEKLFATADGDHDGGVTLTEARPIMPRRPDGPPSRTLRASGNSPEM